MNLKVNDKLVQFSKAECFN